MSELGGALTLVSECLQFYQELNVDSLEEHAQVISRQREESVTERKKLAEETKKYNGLSDEQKASQLKPLLKLYQKEIDRLTARARESEDKFLTLFEKLIKAPDFTAAQQQAHEAGEKIRYAAKLEIENQKLVRELEEFHRDFKEVQNQEVTIRQLEDQVKHYKAKLESMVDSRVKEVEKRLAEEHNAQLQLLQEREEELNTSLKQLRSELAAAQQNNDILQSQLLSIESRYESEISGKQSQIDMLTTEFDRLSSRIATLETENLALKEKSADDNQSKLAELEMQLVQKDLTIVDQSKQLHELQEELEALRQSHTSEIESLTNQLKQQKTQNEELQAKLLSLPSPEKYEKLKNKLKVLKALEYELGESETDAAELTVESVLRDKARKLETENVRLKSSVLGLEEKVNELQRQVDQLRDEMVKKDSLILQLEEDLASRNLVSARAHEPPASAAAAAAYQSRAEEAGPAGTEDPEQKMLEIVSAQRDRFKARMTTLEQQNVSLMNQLKSVQGEVNSLREDNIKLYQKIRYLQSYSYISKQRGSEGKGDIEAQTAGDDVVDKYKHAYEDTVNPFTLFNRTEKAKRYRELNPAEKILLNTSNFFLSNKYTRMFLFFYALTLHLLVFVTVYWLAHRSADCNLSATAT